MRATYLSALCISLSGCASTLQITEDVPGAAAKPIAGVPFHGPELYVRHGFYEKASKGGPCDRTPFADAEVLPLGPLYYANIKPAEFAKSGFTIKFNDTGTVSEITMNTEPSSGEALKNAGELIKVIGPLAGTAAAPLPGSNPACDAGPTSVEWTRFSEWHP